MTSQFRTMFRSEESMKSICLFACCCCCCFVLFCFGLVFFVLFCFVFVTSPGASHVQYLFAAFKKSEFSRLFSSAKSRSLSPLSFLLRVPKGPVQLVLSFIFFYGELASGRRSKGRPQLRYKDVCKRDMKAHERHEST